MANYQIECVTSLKTSLGEAPHWDIQRQSLYFVDVFAKSAAIFRYDFAEDKVYKASIDDVTASPSFIIPVEGTEDEFAISNDGRVAVVQWDGQASTTTVKRIAAVLEPPHGTNDAKGDPRGRLYVSVWPKKETSEVLIHKADGSLYRCVTGEEKVKVVDGLGLPNGLTWNAATNKFYYIDSLTYDIKEYDYDPETGNISNRRVLIDFKVDGENPKFVADGMTIDSNGYLYVAFFMGSKILKINPNSGKIELEIEMPVPLITSVAFGGPQLDILYVTTSNIEMPPPVVWSPLAGSLYKVTGLGVTGLPMSKVRV